MIDEKFLFSQKSYKIKVTDIENFLIICEKIGLKWQHGLKPTEFNPFKFYEGSKIKYIRPIQNIDDINYIFIKCFNGLLRFSFCINWWVAPYEDWNDNK